MLGIEALEQVEVAARTAHEVNRAYCIGIGDDSQKPWGEAEEWQRQSGRAGVAFLIDNPEAPPSSQHESWLAAKELDGWRYGPVKDAQKKEHPCMVLYDKLPEAQKAKDTLFQAAVRGVLAGADE